MNQGQLTTTFYTLHSSHKRSFKFPCCRSNSRMSSTHLEDTSNDDVKYDDDQVEKENDDSIIGSFRNQMPFIIYPSKIPRLQANVIRQNN